MAEELLLKAAKEEQSNDDSSRWLGPQSYLLSIYCNLFSTRMFASWCCTKPSKTLSAKMVYLASSWSQLSIAMSFEDACRGRHTRESFCRKFFNRPLMLIYKSCTVACIRHCLSTTLQGIPILMVLILLQVTTTCILCCCILAGCRAQTVENKLW